MNKAEDEMRAEYRREDLGKGIRGKYFDRVSKGANLVLLDDRVSKAFPQQPRPSIKHSSDSWNSPSKQHA